jgi:hypothetical protein
MGTHYSGLVKWIKWCMIGLQNKTFDRTWYNAMERVWLQNTKLLGNVSNYRFSLWNVDNYQLGVYLMLEILLQWIEGV